MAGLESFSNSNNPTLYWTRTNSILRNLSKPFINETRYFEVSGLFYLSLLSNIYLLILM